jgi:hypothetical protein
VGGIMKNKRKLKQKFKRRKTIFVYENALSKGFGLAPYRSWGKKKVKWESYKLKSDKVEPIPIDYFDMFGYEEEE